MNKSFVVLLTVIFLSPFFSTSAKADWLLDRSGTLVKVDGYVLGDDDSQDSVIEAKENKSETSEIDKKRIEQAREMAKDRQESVREAAKQKLETQIETRKKIQEKIGNKSEVEIKSEENRLKIKQEIRDKNENLVRKQEIEVKDGERFMVEGEDRQKTEIHATKDGRLEIGKNRIKTNSEMELKVDDKNEISVTLPNGKVREVELPDKALENLVSKGIIIQSEGENSYELKTGQNGEPVYPAKAQVEKKLLGLFKLKFNQNIEVAAGDSEDGTVKAGDVVQSESQEKSPWRRLLERLSTN
ncbi:hypothetical protein KBD75_04030 [Candidatus Woesebacteria bacterium]|nr:hypothetical protein [Candidatus Woesebacteria bacterium]